MGRRGVLEFVMAAVSRHVFKPTFEMSPLDFIFIHEHSQMQSSFLQLWSFFQTFYKNKHSWDYFPPKLFFIVKQIRFPLSKDSSTTTWTCQDTGLVTSTCPLLSRAHTGVLCFTECLELIWYHLLLILLSLSSRNTRLWLHKQGGKNTTWSFS